MAYVKEATEEYVEQRIASALSGAMSGMFVVASSLPQAGEAGKIYLVPNNGGESGNVRDEYMWVNGAWELIGSTQVDLSGYYDKTAADGRFVQKETGKGLSTNDYTDADKAKVAAALTAHQDISGKQDTLTFDSAPTASSANPVTSGGVYTALQGKANASDLPYAMVTPGEWSFSGVSAEDNPSLVFEGGVWFLYVEDVSFNSGNTSISAMSVDIDTGGMFGIVTATRASLPGHLLDRSGNRVVVTGDTTLTLPAANPGYIRDFLVRLEISGSTVPTITFAAPTGETITYETDGDEFPVPDEEGTWLYSFTETAPHTFAVALKKVNEVAQGGS